TGLPEWLRNPIIYESKNNSKVEKEVKKIKKQPFLEYNFSTATEQNLKKANFVKLFPVQQATFSLLSKSTLANKFTSDVLVSAMTGSGKTLAYAIPIIETLIKRIVPRIRALIILPTRDLAIQVKQSFENFKKGTNLQVYLITGQQNFETEKHHLNSVKIDILISTPGRLLDHIKEGCVNLEHLRFLVIDEADRLLNQKYKDWLENLFNYINLKNNDNLTSTEKFNKNINFDVDEFGLPISKVKTFRYNGFNDLEKFDTGIISHYTPLQKLLFSATLTRDPSKLAKLNLNNPKYIQIINDDNDKDSNIIFQTPENLTEKIVVIKDNAKKPLILLHLLIDLKLTGVLVFAKSIEAAHRLAALINIFNKMLTEKGDDLTSSSEASSFSESDSSSSSDSLSDADTSGDSGSNFKNKKLTKKKGTTNSTSIKKKIDSEKFLFVAKAFSSTLKASKKKKLLKHFKNKKINCLICSDVMSRGMDLGSCVSTVINYDIPSSTQGYVHRIGRTARAEREGLALSILEFSQVKWFKKEILSKVNRGNKDLHNQLKIDEKSIVEKYLETFLKSLKIVGEMVKGEGTTKPSEQNYKNSVKNFIEDVISDVENSDDDDESLSQSTTKSTSGSKKFGNYKNLYDIPTKSQFNPVESILKNLFVD
ncbi:ATP-dependent RNA helicase dbp6, partial [Clydaea vesicula]